MIQRAFEWYRVAELQPSSQTIDKRIEAVQAIIDAIDNEENDYNIALSCAVGAVVGFETTFQQDSPIVKLIVEAIQSNDSAFPQDLSENALALRACASIALGEILSRNGDDLPDIDSVLIACVLRAGLGFRPPSKGKYLKQMLDEIEQCASKVFFDSAHARRKRIGALTKELSDIGDPPPDLPSAWKALIPALKKVTDNIVEQSIIDREELNVLWWMFAGSSTTDDRLLTEIPLGAAVICCGAELGDLCLIPPTIGLESMVQRAFETGRKSKEITKKLVSDIVADWIGQRPSVLVNDESSKFLARKYPSLFPLSWICERLLDSEGVGDWAAEYERKTGFQSSQALKPAQWAIQVFRERVAHRACQEILGE